MRTVDAIVIGGGFYGAAIAIHLKTQRGARSVTLVEREPALLTRASYRNQARAHNGYHYPRSFTTAFRSRVNLPRFATEYAAAIRGDFTKLYAVARADSKVTMRQFERFCHEIGAPLEAAPPTLRRLFEPRLIEAVFITEEYAFDASVLATILARQLRDCGVSLQLNTQALSIRPAAAGLAVQCAPTGALAADREIVGRHVFNCTYSGLNQFAADAGATAMPLKHELAEIALVSAPPGLAQLGITVMDGPFFSLMPFPAQGLHTLSHVRYTPHAHWPDEPGTDPSYKAQGRAIHTRVDRMLRDVARYLPTVREARYEKSLFEIKTVLVKNESDDGRPILFERHAALPGCYSILGGKIDNIYDVFEKLDTETFAWTH